MSAISPHNDSAGERYILSYIFNRYFLLTLSKTIILYINVKIFTDFVRASARVILTPTGNLSFNLFYLEGLSLSWNPKFKENYLLGDFPYSDYAWLSWDDLVNWENFNDYDPETFQLKKFLI